MKIRDLLVILFTAIMALLLLGRAALADGSCPANGAGGACPGLPNSHEGDPEDAFSLEFIDWMCADSCAALCRVRCGAACVDSKDPYCLQGCYPVCAEECYFECSGPRPLDLDLDLVESGDDPSRLLLDVDGGAP